MASKEVPEEGQALNGRTADSCPRCGTRVTSEQERCPQCGLSLVSAGTVPIIQVRPGVRWLGATGFIAGVFLGIYSLVTSLNQAFMNSTSPAWYIPGPASDFALGIGIILFSVLGALGCYCKLNKRRAINGVGILVASIGIVIAALGLTSAIAVIFGVIPCVLFLFAAVLLLSTTTSE